MILAHHLIFIAYGFWLPNDPRGSWSTWVRSWDLFRYGPATKTDTRRSVAATTHDAALRRAAKSALRYPPVKFDGLQARAIARGFAQASKEYGYTIHACAILPDHVHLVVARHARTTEQLRDHLKSRATRQLNIEAINPMPDVPAKPSPWARKGWQAFLDSPEDIERAIRYARNNPLKDGLREQHWPFVVPWSAGPDGHR
ncbi:MAG: hypothetical protein WC058_03280 [Phycisphaeraceae bacterium]